MSTKPTKPTSKKRGDAVDDTGNTLPGRAIKHAPSIALFIGTMVVVLAVDLISKPMSFEHVAGEPLLLSRSEKDGTTLVSRINADGEVEVLPRLLNANGTEQGPASAIPYHEGIDVIPSILRLKLTLNTGAVFGIGKNKQLFFVLVSMFAVGVIGMVFYRSKAESFWLHFCLGLILAGALGNLYDRIFYNAVRDMFWLFPDVKLPFGWTWFGGADDLYPWLFNVADVALVFGVGIMLILMWRADAAEKRDAEKST